MENYLIFVLVVGGVLFLMGFGGFIAARKQDRQNYIIQKVTPMSLSMVNPRDDVWLKGVAECDAPVTTPEFGYTCLFFGYVLKKKSTRTVRDSNGKTRTETYWKTIKRERDAANFNLVEGELRISITGQNAEFRHYETDSKQVGDYRHTVSYFPYPSDLNAIGTISEDKTGLEAYDNIPLIISSKDREDFIKDAEQQETKNRLWGFLLTWTGITGITYGLLDYNSYPFESAGQFQWEMLKLALIPATIIILLTWVVHIYNRFVTCRNRTANAWRQVDVDLAMRYNLIPQLVNVVKGYMKHEKELLTKLVKLRNTAIAAGQDDKVRIEDEMLGSMNMIIARIEDYPDLKAEPVMQKLNKEMKAIEEKIAHGRTTYNEAVLEYNDIIQKIPNVIVARLMGLKPKVYFDIGHS